MKDQYGRPLCFLLEVRVGFRFCSPFMLVPFTKPHLGVQEQLALLQRRGMTITDPVKAGEYLERIGYYRLSGYWHPLRQSQTLTGSGGKSGIQVLDAFRPGVEFGHAVDLYVFERGFGCCFWTRSNA